MLTRDRFLAEVEAFLKRSGMNATTFGKAAVGDPSFVPDLRKGRGPRLEIVERVGAYIASQKRRRRMREPRQ